jgi:DNA excision repair protein ERCC-8
MTADGRHLVSLGLDEKIRLWDTETGHNTFVNYGNTFRNAFKFCLYPTSSGPLVKPPLLYVPSDDRQVLVFNLFDGALVKRLKGAYGRVTCIDQRKDYMDLYSGSKGGDIMIWEPPMQDDLGSYMEEVIHSLVFVMYVFNNRVYNRIWIIGVIVANLYNKGH